MEGGRGGREKKEGEGEEGGKEKGREKGKGEGESRVYHG